jgi:pilus assembly protein CpaE
MTEHASILLPPGRVAFYVTDGALAAAAAQLSQDWRFARVNFDIVTGDIAAATEAYSHAASPELVIVETDDISDAFIAKLGALAGVCAQGTDAVIIGPKNDVHLYRSLIGMGVRDYLVRPVAETDLAQIIARALLDKKGVSDSRLAVVLGAKGGVGATAVAQSLAYVAAHDLGQKTLLLDAAGSAGTLGIAYGLEGATGFAEALRVGQSGSEDDMRRLVQKAGDNLSLIVTGGDAQLADHADADGFERLLQRLMTKHPLTVFDASGAARGVQKRAIALAKQITLVTTPVLSALRNTRALLAEIKIIRGHLDGVDLVINMKGRGGADEVPAADIRAALSLDPAVTVAYQSRLFAQSESGGQPAAAQKTGAELRTALLPLAARAGGVPATHRTQPGARSGSLLSKLIRK